MSPLFDRELRFAEEAFGCPYHAALVRKPAAVGASPLHGHADFYEFMAVVEGSGRNLLPVGAQELRPGDVVLVRPQDRHEPQGAGPHGMRFVNVAFPAQAWHHFTGIVELPDSTGAEPALWRLGGAASERAQQLFRRVLNRFHHEPSMIDALRFWTDLVELLGGDRTPGEGAAGPEWLVRARSDMHLETHLREGVPRLTELAAVSAAHLSRSMREHYGTTPTAFVTDLRLQRAAELLGTTSESVTRIAHRCGFSSQSYFTRCFRGAYGMPPKEYRRRSGQAFVPGPPAPAP
ncbi:AraC family transcriptional regulator [Pseudonocardia sp. MH-G8]|uniref:helix-turn-helix transcriptional regulator n=1 Tax=Pseudonocardia sp. MH-G8 TaxID=1854588 RepID=UPI0018E9B1AE|nr:AraC family transcriptional regulator [Pseudonocardia sp. MH-G8]